MLRWVGTTRGTLDGASSLGAAGGKVEAGLSRDTTPF